MNADVARPITVDALADDVRGVQTRLDDILSGLAPHEWTIPTPAVGWDIQDQLAHIALVEEYGLLAVTEPERFAALAEEAAADSAGFERRLYERGCTYEASQLLRTWRRVREEVITALVARDGARFSWFGPSMSARSFLTARLMETWAHGQDVRDALGLPADETPAALRHIAHLGVRTRGWSNVVRGLAPDETPVRVVLTDPEGDTWTWGPADARDAISGSALDFCLVVTQRRHWQDTELRVEGSAARHWMETAQAFAGPPTTTARYRAIDGSTQRAGRGTS